MRRAALLPFAFALAACGGGADPAPVATPSSLPPFRHAAFYDALEAEADGFSVVKGDWLEDYGDAPFYGLAFLARTAATGPRRDRAEAARARAVDLVDDADIVNGDVNEFVMSALGLMEDMDARGDRTDEPALDLFVHRLCSVVEAIGWYLDGDLAKKSWAIQTYGPTSVSALVGLVAAQYALVLGGEKAAERTEWAREMERRIAERAWNGTSFAFGAGREGLFLYPNVAMILLETRLARLTGDPAYRDRALAAYQGIQPLRLPGTPVRYYSPYSAEYMGAKTRDYSTLSSHNYLVLALYALYETTGDARFVAEADSVVDALSGPLFGTWCLTHRHRDPCDPPCARWPTCVAGECVPDRCQRGVLHHYIDGRIALPSDKEYFCSGCNMQLLYAMWYRRTRLK